MEANPLNGHQEIHFFAKDKIPSRSNQCENMGFKTVSIVDDA
jgi:hypothetical protein